MYASAALALPADEQRKYADQYRAHDELAGRDAASSSCGVDVGLRHAQPRTFDAVRWLPRDQQTTRLGARGAARRPRVERVPAICGSVFTGVFLHLCCDVLTICIRRQSTAKYS